MKLLEVKNLKTYFDTSKGQLKAVDDVSFDLDYGEALGLVGESGCGKTTSALSICRLLPKEGKVYGGEILLEGSDLAKLSDDEIRRHRWKDISVIFQGAMNALNPVMNIGDQIAEAVMLHDGLSKADALKRAGDLLELVEISRGRVANYPHEFSGGMKQRVMIAMALACNPQGGHRRRADHSAGRHGAGTDPEPVGEAEKGTEHGADSHHSRPFHSGRDL